DDGLDLRAYAAPDAGELAPTAADELALSEAIAAYALQARGSRVDPESISHLIGAKTALPDPARAVADIAGAGETAGDALHAYNPAHYGYQQLREKLIGLRAQRASAPASDGRYAAAESGAQSDALPIAGRSKRRRAGPAAASTSRVEAEIIANMERWRWLPRDLGEERVEVNIPDFELAVVRNGEVTHRTRVIVGKETTPTPIFSNALQYIIVNPYWNVPPSILKKEMLPKANGDVAAIAASGFNVSYRGGKLVVRQPPGERNALGRIKFMFPNDFSVYLHDTPSRNLFAASHRAFSHGCMRVDAPFALAEAVLGPGSGWSENRVRRLIGGSERYINLSKPLPIHIEYFTAYVDEGGRLVLRPDLYGYSARVRTALGLGA
ncbi:MAG: L,D-transpeptidase, partial [Alphaproteobacteria bacterium]|nr:L,D-transpeptidase [Alphaproteobacteria bacterium]